MGSVVTFGNFDGVHLGHQALLECVREVANARGLEPVVITFTPHPLAVHQPGTPMQLLTGYRQRLCQLKRSGIVKIEEIDYTPEFAEQSDREFVQNHLVTNHQAEVIVLGSDAKFGAGNTGNLDTLRRLAPAFGFEVIEFQAVGPERGPRWSSSAARAAVTGGDMVSANQILGRMHTLTGLVVHGDHRGRTLGFPTANLADIDGLVPGDGVYAGYLDGQAAAISIGTNPTFTDGPLRRVEAYVLDRDDLDLYGQIVQLEFVAKLRDTLKFESVPELLQQMHRDIGDVRRITTH